ncbi:zinc and cadmium transporter [Pedobacter sp. UYP30]|uniref:ZIP family metal transporter n=1 Tax=Pedobacter sp. UYP30 TaxID=1756400 RepID=UPI003396683C
MSLLIIFLLLGSALLGGLSVFVFKKNQHNNLKLILAFSGAYIFSITILHILPDVYQSNVPNVGLFILGGFIFQVLLEQFSSGLEHGHIKNNTEKEVFSLGIMLSLSLHAFLEGMPLSANSSSELVYGIALHHIPVAFALGSVLLSKGVSNQNTVLLLIAFACMSPLGYLFSFELNRGIVGLHNFYPYALGMAIGILLHISTTILFESSPDHRFSRKKTMVVLLGVGIALLNYFLK